MTVCQETGDEVGMRCEVADGRHTHHPITSDDGGNPPVEMIRCPVHGVPDCSPLLNGCTIPVRLAEAYRDGYDAGYSDADAGG